MLLHITATVTLKTLSLFFEYETYERKQTTRNEPQPNYQRQRRHDQITPGGGTQSDPFVSVTRAGLD